MTGGPKILVTGSTGNTGRPLVTKLLERGVSVRAASRHPNPDAADGVRFDWYDPATFDGALAGVDAVYLVPPPLDPDPQVAMAPFLGKARQAGVSRVVLLGASIVQSGGPAVGQVQKLLPQMFDEWVVLRPSWFMQNFVSGHHHAESARTMGKIVTATGQGRVAFIDVDDIAEVAAHALVAHEPIQGDLILTGPEALSYADVAATLTEVLAQPVRHESVTAQELERILAQDMPARAAAMLASIDELLARGIEDRTTDTVARVTGRPPRNLKETLRPYAQRRGAPLQAEAVQFVGVHGEPQPAKLAGDAVEHDAGFETAQGRAQAEVDSVAEGDVPMDVGAMDGHSGGSFAS